MTGTAYFPVSAGSPGPFERKTPSGRIARIDSAGCLRRHDGDRAAGLGQKPQDIAFDPVIDGDDLVFPWPGGTKTLSRHPCRFRPVVALRGGDLRHEVHAFEARPFPRHRPQAIDVEIAALANGR